MKVKILKEKKKKENLYFIWLVKNVLTNCPEGNKMSHQCKIKCNSASSRLRHDYIRIKKDPVPYVVAEPLPSNILEW